MRKKFDVIVIGLGAMGSAATCHLAKKGVRVLGIDRFDPPHVFGSSHGDTRITRQAIGEGRECIPLVLRSYELWREIEAQTGEDLLTITGGLVMTGYSTGSAMHGNKDFLKETIDSAKQYDIQHQVLDTEEIREIFPQFNLAGDEIGYYEPMAGFLRPENCIRAQLNLAKQFGAVLATNEKVENILPFDNSSGVLVETSRDTYFANKIVISAGSWVSGFLDTKTSTPFKVYRQILLWFGVKGSVIPYLVPNFPIFIWINNNNFIYGFPAIDGPDGGVKVASEQTDTTSSPDRVVRVVSPSEISEMYDKYIKHALPGLTENCVKATTCLYTKTPDSKFVIDFHPEYPQVIVASPCSGHGFKHSVAIGEVLSELATEGKSKIDISPFSFKRFNL